jgi:membrane protein
MFSSIKNWLTHPWQLLWGFCVLIIQQYQDKGCQKSAASLTYMTLFATVPMLTVTYSMFSIIPAFQNVGDQLQNLIFEQFLPRNEQDISKYFKSFSEQARQLTLLGVAFLMVSAYLMLKNIEKNFNAIWGVAKGRRGVANFLLYWAILSLGPLLLGVALAMTTYLTSFKLLVGPYDSLGLMEQVFKYVPWVLTWAAFTLLFATVPNCKVPLNHAMAGGLVTTIGVQVLKAVFAWLVSYTSFSLVYGAFAVLPLFLLWVNLIWMVILGGAVFVHSIKFYQIGLKDRAWPDLFASLVVIWQLYLHSSRGQAMTEWQILQQGLSTQQWQRISNSLLNSRIITQTQQGDFMLSHDLKRLTLQQLANSLGLPPILPVDKTSRKFLPWLGQAQLYLGGVDDFRTQAWDISLDEFFVIHQTPDHK